MQRRHKFSSSRKPVLNESKWSIALAVVSAAAFLFCIIVSAVAGGSGASYIGAVGLASALLALYGCVLGIQGLSKAKTEYKRSYTGAILCGVIFVIWLAVFLSGIKA